MNRRPGRVGFITAMVDEAQTLASNLRPRPGAILELDSGALLIVAGLGFARAAAGARSLIAQGAGLLVSWGTAGGLDPKLAAGALVIPEQVVDARGQTYFTDPLWRNELLHTLSMPIAGGVLMSVDAPLASAAAKSRCYALSGAVAVDMESAAIAKVAREAELPFIVVRAIVDCANTSLPAAALAAMDEDGQLRPARMMRALSRAPKDLMRLAKLAPKFAAARASLRIAASTATLRGLPHH